MDTYDLYESNVRSYCRSIPIEFAGARNATLTARDGTSYIDFLSGCGALNYGHNDEDMKRSLVRYILADGPALSLDLHTPAKEDFLNTFAQLILLPRNLDYKVQFTGPTGANAVEAALKLARKLTGRTEVIAFTNGFHGCSLGALAATGSSYHRGAAGTFLSGVARFPYEHYLPAPADTADFLERMLDDPSSGAGEPAALLLETVQGEGGLNCASPGWLQRMRSIADKHHALLIVDDIQAGCGRTGSFFSFESCGITPDIVVLSKSLSGFGLPLSAVLMRREMDAWRPGEHNGTFRGNCHAFVTATVALRKFWTSNVFSETILAHANAMRQAIEGIADRTGFLPRGRGMMQGFATPGREVAEKIRSAALRYDLILETCGPHDEVVKLMPPLTIEEELLEQGLTRLANAVEDAATAHVSLHARTH